MKTELSPTQQRLMDMFKKPNVDVTILAIYGHVYENNYPQYIVTRDMQQKLAPVISRTNAKLVGKRIVPGHLKRTYRLELTAKA